MEQTVLRRCCNTCQHQTNNFYGCAIPDKCFNGLSAYETRNGMEQWYVKVQFNDGDIIETRINGKKTDVEEYYTSGKIFNLGSVYDRMVKVDKILEIKRISNG